MGATSKGREGRGERGGDLLISGVREGDGAYF